MAQTVGAVAEGVAATVQSGYPWAVPEEIKEWTPLPWLSCKSGDECGACCKACWCPCMTMKQNMDLLQMKEGHPAWGGCSSKLHIWIGLAFAFSTVFMSIAGFFSTIPILYYALYIGGFVLKGLQLWANMWFRKEVTKQFNIKWCDGVGCLVDCCCPWYCHCWSMPQETKSIETLIPTDLVGGAIAAVSKIVKEVV